jgi:phage terminase large subunit
MDFGFVNDPTTIIRVAVDKRKKILYLREEWYEYGQSTEQICTALKRLVERKELIVADCAEPRLIGDVQAEGFNIVSCEKGKDSVRLGLANMKEYNIVVTPDSHNIKKEMNHYIWNDRKSNTPIDNFNHTIDAARYAFDELTNISDFYIG